MSWFDILKEPLISVPKSIVSMKKPKKVETKEECKERLKAFIEKVKNVVGSQEVIEVGNNNLDGIPEEAVCKALELLRKEANNKEYVDGGVSYRGKFPEVRERSGNLQRMEDVGEWEITVLFAKFDMRTREEMRSKTLERYILNSITSSVISLRGIQRWITRLVSTSIRKHRNMITTIR